MKQAITRAAVAAGILVATAVPVTARAASSTTEHFVHVGSERIVQPCTGEPGTLSFVERITIHMTERSNGTTAHATLATSVTFTPDGGGPLETGRSATTLTDVSTERVVISNLTNITTAGVRGTGERSSLRIQTHVTLVDGRPVATFDRVVAHC